MGYEINILWSHRLTTCGLPFLEETKIECVNTNLIMELWGSRLKRLDRSSVPQCVSLVVWALWGEKDLFIVGRC